MEETWVWALVWEDPTCHQTTKPRSHNYWVCALEPRNHSYWACTLNYWSLCTLKPVLYSKRSHLVWSLLMVKESSTCSLQLEKSLRTKKHPAQLKINFKSFFFFNKKEVEPKLNNIGWQTLASLEALFKLNLLIRSVPFMQSVGAVSTGDEDGNMGLPWVTGTTASISGLGGPAPFCFWGAVALGLSESDKKLIFCFELDNIPGSVFRTPFH